MKKRRYDYDVLRVCSMLGVIYLHVAAGAFGVCVIGRETIQHRYGPH